MDVFYEGDYQDIPKRGLHEGTLKKFGYRIGRYDDQPVQIAPYYDADGTLIATKLRFKDKTFKVTGSGISECLFGRKLWSPGKRLVITEGEIDTLSYAQATNLSWAVVSVPNGASGALKTIKANLEWIEQFEEVVFFFDNDEPGQTNARKCAELLTPGRAKNAVAPPPFKDPSDMLQAGEVKAMLTAVYTASVVRPDGIVNASELWDKVSKPLEMGTPYPWEHLNAVLFGLRPREIVTLCAGSGLGKSTICAEIAYARLKAGDKVGYVALEDGVDRTALRFMGLELNRRIHLPGVAVSDEERRRAFDATCGTGRLVLYDHFGSLDSDNLLNKLRYMVKGLGCKWLFLDHLSIVVSGMDADEDERRAIDRTMTRLRSFTEETGAGLVLVSHLKRPPGMGHEEGAKISLAQLRGSASIAQLSDSVIGVERDQQAEDEEDRNTIHIRVLKNRYAGITGPSGELVYDMETGRLKAVDTEFGETPAAPRGTPDADDDDDY